MPMKLLRNGRGLLLVAALLALAPSIAPAVLQVGQEAPNWSLPDTAGVYHQLSDWRGQCVMLLFWQST
jgi:hypothetical protein